jgi:hypothetical protein
MICENYINLTEITIFIRLLEVVKSKKRQNGSLSRRSPARDIEY